MIIDFSKFSNHSGGILRIVNAVGQVLHQQNIASGLIKIQGNLAQLVPGIYRIEIAGNDKNLCWLKYLLTTGNNELF